MARTKTNTQNDTKTRTTSWRNRHLKKNTIFLCDKLISIYCLTDYLVPKMCFNRLSKPKCIHLCNHFCYFRVYPFMTERRVGIQPLKERRQAKILLQAEKFKYILDIPMKSRLPGYTKNRLKRNSFVHEAKKLIIRMQGGNFQKVIH